MESGWPWVIRLLREESKGKGFKLTQLDFAQETYVDPMSVSRWERGVVRPSPGARHIIADYYLKHKSNIPEAYLKPIEEFFKKEHVIHFW